MLTFLNTYYVGYVFLTFFGIFSTKQAPPTTFPLLSHSLCKCKVFYKTSYFIAKHNI